MRTKVEFLLLASSDQWVSNALKSLTELYKDHDRILVLGEKRQYIEQLDELLWHNSSENFLPYSLDTECYSSSAAILLADLQPDNNRYQALLNIGGQIIHNIKQFRVIIELIHNDENCKQKARERYKFYRQQGFDVSHKQLLENKYE